MLLAHAKIDYEDERLDFSLFRNRKAAGDFPNGQLPVLTHNGKTLNESVAILRYLGKHFGYYPADAYEAWYADSLVDFSNDYIGKFAPIIFGGKFDEDTKKTYVAALTAYAAYFNKHLKSHGKAFLAGDKPTIADFHVTSVLHSVALNKASPIPADWHTAVQEILAANPEFHAYTNKMGAELKDYLASRPAANF